MKWGYPLLFVVLALSPQSRAQSPAVQSEDLNLVDVQSKGFEYPEPIVQKEELAPEPAPQESPDPSRLSAGFLQTESETLHLPLEMVALGERMRLQSAEDQWKLFEKSKERAGSPGYKVPQRGIASVPTYDFSSESAENPPPRIEVVPKSE